MGQTWSKFMSGHMEAGNNTADPETEICTSPDPSDQQSPASTEASSSVPVYQGGPFSVAAADVELSSLQHDDWDEERDHERGKETQITLTPTPSTSQQQLSPVQAYLKGLEKLHQKKSQASPSTTCKCEPLKMYDRKLRAVKQAHISSPPAITRLLQNHASKVDAQPAQKLRTRLLESSTPSPSQFSPSQVQDEEDLQMDDDDDGDEVVSESILPEPEDDLKMESNGGENLEHSSAQKLLLFELDHKRKAPAGLPSLAVACIGASPNKLKARTQLVKQSEAGSTKEAMVGRRVRKAIGNRSISEGHVASYDVSSSLCQKEYENGKEEAMEWLALEPCLVDRSKTISAPVKEKKRTTTLTMSLRNAPKVKNVETFMCTKKEG